MNFIRAAKRHGLLSLAGAVSCIASHGTSVTCTSTAHDNAMRNLYVPPTCLVPVWERMVPRLSIGTRSVIGMARTYRQPPPIIPQPPPVAPPPATDHVLAVMPGKRRRIRWPKAPQTDEEEKAREIRKWQSSLRLPALMHAASQGIS